MFRPSRAARQLRKRMKRMKRMGKILREESKIVIYQALREAKLMDCPDCSGTGKGCGCSDCMGTDGKPGVKGAGKCLLCHGTGMQAA